MKFIRLLTAKNATKKFDYGYKTGGEVIEIHPFVNRKERNEEICRLYYEKDVSQLFLANLFNMSQPSVSVIVNKK